MPPLSATPQNHSFNGYRIFFLSLLGLFSCDIKMSLLIMSLLLSLEELNENDSIVERLVTSIHISDVESTIKEAISCLKFLASDSDYFDYNIQGITFNINPLGLFVPIRSLYLYKYTTISRIKKHLRETCCSLLFDIVSNILSTTSEVPGFPDLIFGPIDFHYYGPVDRAYRNTQDLWSLFANNLENEVDRSLYVTFSRGLYVTEEEVNRVFFINYGDCVQYVDMPHTNDPKHQVLFARVIMKYVEYIDMVLQGRNTAKFMIRGKHVWAKKYKTPRFRN